MKLAGFVRKPFPACEAAGVTPRFLNFHGDDPLAFVLSLNLHRRHLNAGQLAVVGLKIEKIEAEKARERMLAGKPADPVPNLAQGSDDTGKASEKAAAAVGCSPAQLRKAKKLEKNRPDLVKKVESGELSLHAAERKADEDQRKVELARPVKIRDKAAALEAYARQKNDIEMERWVAEIKLRAITRIGEISAELDVAQGLRTDRPRSSDGPKSKQETLRKAGISPTAAKRAEKLAAHKDQVEAYIQRKAEKREPVKYTEILHAVEMNKREQERKEILQRPVKIRIEPGLHRGDLDQAGALQQPDVLVDVHLAKVPVLHPALEGAHVAAVEDVCHLRDGIIATCRAQARHLAHGGEFAPLVALAPARLAVDCEDGSRIITSQDAAYQPAHGILQLHHHRIRARVG